LSGYSTIKLLFLLLFHTVLFGGSHYAQPAHKDWGFMLDLLKGRNFRNYLEFICKGDLSLLFHLFTYFFIDSFNHLFVAIWTHKILFHTLGYNLILAYCFVALIIPILVVMSSFSGSCVSLAYPIITGFKKF